MVTAQRQYKKILLSEVVSYERNNKKHGKNVARIADSIKRNEYIAPIIIDENNIILAGHGRKLALEQLGTTEVEVLQVSGLTEKQKADFRIADNRTTELSEWDYEAVLAEIGEFELEDLKLDFPDLDFDDDTLGGGAGEDEEIDEDQEIFVKVGDIFDVGGHVLMCGDSTDVESIAKLMGKNKADMVFTDPPYGMHLDTDRTSIDGGNYKKVAGDGDDFDPRFITNILEQFKYCNEIFLRGADYYAEYLLPYKNDGARFCRDKRSDGLEVNGNPDAMLGSMFELCWSKAKHKRSVVRIGRAGSYGLHKDDIGRLHPTQKPRVLAERFLKNYCKKKKENIVDLYAGSGFVMLACEELGHKSFNMEYEPLYIQVILKRYHDYTKGQREIKCLNRDLDLSPILQND